jgi:hypothetical protein
MHPANVTPFPCAPNLNPSAPCCCPLRSRLLLLLLPQRRQTNTRDLDDLESNTGDITLRLTLTTESSEQDLVVLVYEVETTIVGNYISSAIVLIHPISSSAPQIPNPFLKSWGNFCAELTESSNLLSILNQLDTHTLPNRRIGLLGLDTDLLKNYSLGVRRASEGRRLECRSQRPLLVREIGPALLATVVLQLAGGVESTGLSFTHDCCQMSR